MTLFAKLIKSATVAPESTNHSKFSCYPNGVDGYMFYIDSQEKGVQFLIEYPFFLENPSRTDPNEPLQFIQPVQDDLRFENYRLHFPICWFRSLIFALAASRGVKYEKCVERINTLLDENKSVEKFQDWKNRKHKIEFVLALILLRFQIEVVVNYQPYDGLLILILHHWNKLEEETNGGIASMQTYGCAGKNPNKALERLLALDLDLLSGVYFDRNRKPGILSTTKKNQISPSPSVSRTCVIKPFFHGNAMTEMLENDSFELTSACVINHDFNLRGHAVCIYRGKKTRRWYSSENYVRYYMGSKYFGANDIGYHSIPIGNIFIPDGVDIGAPGMPINTQKGWRLGFYVPTDPTRGGGGCQSTNYQGKSRWASSSVPIGVSRAGGAARSATDKSQSNYKPNSPSSSANMPPKAATQKSTSSKSKSTSKTKSNSSSSKDLDKIFDVSDKVHQCTKLRCKSEFNDAWDLKRSYSEQYNETIAKLYTLDKDLENKKITKAQYTKQKAIFQKQLDAINEKSNNNPPQSKLEECTFNKCQAESKAMMRVATDMATVSCKTKKEPSECKVAEIGKRVMSRKKIDLEGYRELTKALRT